MAWSWSHTPEAYADAYDNLHNQSHDWLVVCLAEIQASNHDADSVVDFGYDLDLASYDVKVKDLESLSEETLADAIWEFASEFATCDNGGWNAYCCPYGCHTVPFNKGNESN